MRRIIIAGACALASCATPGVKITETASGRPEAIFYDATIADISTKIASKCLDFGQIVQEASPSGVVCAREANDAEDLLGTLLIGNAYSTRLMISARFTILQQGADVRVVAYQWMETQMAFGQMRRHELGGADHFNRVQMFLEQLGGLGPYEPRPALFEEPQAAVDPES